MQPAYGFENKQEEQVMECGARERVWGISVLCLGGCQGAAVMVSVSHQHVSKCVVESVGLGSYFYSWNKYL